MPAPLVMPPHKYLMLKLLSYLKARCGERSTWAAIGLGVPAAAALTAPWSYLLLAISIVGAVVPTS